MPVPTFHPDLAAGRFIPRYSMGPRLTRLMRRGKPPLPPVPDDLVIREVVVPFDGCRARRVAAHLPAS